ARRSARRQVGTKGWSYSDRTKGWALELNSTALAHHAQFAELDAHNFTRPFCELGPARTDQVPGVIGRHFDGAVRADVDVPAREGLHGPHTTRRRLQANPISFRVLGVLTALGSHAVVLQDRLARVRLLE